MGINMHKDLEALGGVETPTMIDFWNWVTKTFSPSYQDEIESYFSDCVDHADVERVAKNLKYRGML
jgi:hypothetical protein